jgi:hypothetical protein
MNAEFDFGPEFTEEELRILDAEISNHTTYSVAELPDDVLLAILSLCDFKALLALSATCKRLHETSNYGITAIKTITISSREINFD